MQKKEIEIFNFVLLHCQKIMYDRAVASLVSYLRQNIKSLFSRDRENFYLKSYYEALIMVGTMYHPLQQIDFVNDVNKDPTNLENLL